jgi:hypothetical protein
MADARVSWEFDGLQNVKDKIAKIERALEPEELSPIMDKGAQMFVNYAREGLNDHVRSGALRDSIDRARVGPLSWIISPYVNDEENDRGTPAHVYAETQESGATLHAKSLPDVLSHVDYTPTMKFLGYFGRWVEVEEVTIPAVEYMRYGFEVGKTPAVEVVKQEFNKRSTAS